MRLLLSVFLLVALSARAVGAQAPVGACGSADGGVVKGTVLDDSTGQPIGGARVHLLHTDCSTTADGVGRFRFEQVPAGRGRIDALRNGYRSFAGLDIELKERDSVAVAVRLRAGGPLQDCRMLAACAPLLADSATAPLNGYDALRLVALSTMIALAWKEVTNPSPWYACLEKGDSALIGELGKRYPRVVHASACSYGPGLPGPFRERTMHRASREPAFGFRIDRIEDHGADRKRVMVSYMVVGRWGAGWRCDFARTRQGWRPVLCVQEWQA